MGIELKFTADTSAELRDLLTGTAALFDGRAYTSSVYSEAEAPAAANTARPEPAPAPAVAPSSPPPTPEAPTADVSTSGGTYAEGADDGGSDDDETKPMRGKNAERAAEEIKAKLDGAETPEAVRDVLKDAETTIGRLPKRLQTEVGDHANGREAALADAPPPADNAATTEPVPGDAAPAPTPGAASAPAAAEDFPLFNTKGEKVGAFGTAREWVEALVGGVEKSVLAGEVTQQGLTALAQANRDVLLGKVSKDYPDLAEEANRRWFAVMRQISPENAATEDPAAAVAEKDAKADAGERVYTAEDVRRALETCITNVSFQAAAERMGKLGYKQLSDVPEDNVKRAEFVAALTEGIA